MPLFPSHLHDLLLNPRRYEETVARAQCLDLRLYRVDLAIFLSSQQHAEQACDPQFGALGCDAAALAALRSGLRVFMTEEAGWVGGQSTSQAVLPDETSGAVLEAPPTGD